MMTGPYVVYDAAGNELAGDEILDEHLKSNVDANPGSYIKDADGVTVYPEES